MVPTGPVTDATSFKVTTHQFLWRPVYRGVHAHQSTSYYGGLSFKSGYHQTGYIHPILSYYDVKYYYCLELGAWGLVEVRTAKGWTNLISISTLYALCCQGNSTRDHSRCTANYPRILKGTVITARVWSILLLTDCLFLPSLFRLFLVLLNQPKHFF